MVMKIFGWSVIRWKNLQRVHELSKQRMARIEELESDNRSLRNTVTHHEDSIEALENKCSLVNVSAMKNRIIELEGKLNAQALPGHELSLVDPGEPALLPEPLVLPARNDAAGYIEFTAPDDGTVSEIHRPPVSGSEVS